MLPILDQVLGWKAGRIRGLLESHGLALQDWQKDRTDRVKIGELLALSANQAAAS